MQIDQSLELQGQVPLCGAKNAVLVIIASLLLTRGKSRLTNVPGSADMLHMIMLLQELGAHVTFLHETHTLDVDTTNVNNWKVSASIMKKMRASVLVMGSLISRFGIADIAVPGGCSIGERPIDLHIKNFIKLGVDIQQDGEYLHAKATNLKPARLVLEYPSVGATENILLAAVTIPGKTTIVNAALEPEVLDLITVLTKMGAQITICAPSTIEIEGVAELHPIEHAVMYDRLEAGVLLLSAAITGGHIYLPHASVRDLDCVLLKLDEMGHHISFDSSLQGIHLTATKNPRAVSIKTGQFPGFPTDLQACMTALLCVAEGTSIVEETVYENRLLHVPELIKMGAQITIDRNKAIIKGVDMLKGTLVKATDIRASSALVLAGFKADGVTHMTELHHWFRGYDALDIKFRALGGKIQIFDGAVPVDNTAHMLNATR